jgi:hypothetical protein
VKEVCVKDEMNLSDKLAALNRALVGAIPYAGPAISEIICALIPNQRLSRAIKFLNTINYKVEELADSLQRNVGKVGLIETGLKAATNSNYEEKCEWIGNIVIGGISDKVEVPIAESLISIVEDLNREQIILLYYSAIYYHQSIVEKGKFVARFPEVFELHNEFIRDDEKRALLQNKERLNTTKLLNLGLIENSFRIPILPDHGISASYSRNDLEYLKKQLRELNRSIIDYNESTEHRPTELGRLVIETMMIKDDSLK